jgi:hypothetical protein
VTLQGLLDRCNRAGVRLALKADGSGVRYRAPGGLDPELRDMLVTHREELLDYLARPDAVAAQLGEMEHDPALRALVHPDWYRLPAGIFDEVPDARLPRPDLPTTVILLRGTEREVRQLAVGEAFPDAAVLWSQPGSPCYWLPGRAHALGGSGEQPRALPSRGPTR